MMDALNIQKRRIFVNFKNTNCWLVSDPGSLNTTRLQSPAGWILRAWRSLQGTLSEEHDNSKNSSITHRNKLQRFYLTYVLEQEIIHHVQTNVTRAKATKQFCKTGTIIGLSKSSVDV